jgi:anti-sigma factor RsiW
MKSPHFDKYFILYLDGELPEGQRQALEAHVQVCASCQAGLKQLRLVYQPEAGIRRLPLPSFAWTRLQPLIRDAQLRPRVRPADVLHLLRPMAMAATLLLALLFGYYLGDVPVATDAAAADPGLEQALSLDIFSANPPLSLGAAMMTVYGQVEGRVQ